MLRRIILNYNAGIDIKYNINSNLTLDLTANTDFAQVEADDQQVNLTRYSLFFPEKRMFFQERSSLFDFSLGGHVRQPVLQQEHRNSRRRTYKDLWRSKTYRQNWKMGYGFPGYADSRTRGNTR